VLTNDRPHGTYTGQSQHAEPHRIADEHNRGSRASTKNKGPWRVAFLVGPFDSRVAAQRLERLVKRGAKGIAPKLAAARTELADRSQTGSSVRIRTF